MQRSHAAKWRTTLAAGSALAALGSGAMAQSLTFNQTPASNAIAKIQQRYGISISLKGGLNAARPVSFSVDGTGTRADRLQAINELANSLGGDFRKVYAVSPSAAGAAPPAIKVDSDSNVQFSATTLPAADAIQTVAGADDAIAQVDSQITGNVRLSEATLTVPQAAAEIARQTHSRWKVYYAIFPRSMASRFTGKVIGRTATGRAIIQSPLNVYQKPVQVATQPNDNADPNAAAAADGSLPTNPAPDIPLGGAVQGYSPYGYYPYGQGAYSAGLDPYGNYGFNGLGYGPSGFLTPGGVFATTNDPYANVQSGPFPGFSFGGGYSNPAGGLTVLPNFPYFGGYGGPIVIGGGGGFGF